MPDEPIEIRTGAAVAKPANGVDWANLASTIAGAGLATWLVVTQIPAINKSIAELREANRAHFQAISDDRRVQFDHISRELLELKLNVAELRRGKTTGADKAAPNPN